MKYNIGDLFICQAECRGILIEIKDVEPNTPYEKFVLQSQPYEKFVIHWSYTDHRAYEVGYNLLELNATINKGHWKHFPVNK